MQKDILSDVEQLNKATLDAAKRLGEINMRVLERMAERQLAFATDYLETGFAQMKHFGEPRDLQAVVTSQTKFVSEMNQKLVEHAKKTAEVLSDARSEYADWVDDGLEAAGAARSGAAAKASAGPKKAA